MTKKNRNILVIIFIIVLLSFGVWAKRFLAIDKCLDSGGRWDYKRGECINYERALEVDKCLNNGGRWNFEKDECEKLGSNQ